MYPHTTILNNTCDVQLLEMMWWNQTVVVTYGSKVKLAVTITKKVYCRILIIIAPREQIKISIMKARLNMNHLKIVNEMTNNYFLNVAFKNKNKNKKCQWYFEWLKYIKKYIDSVFWPIGLQSKIFRMYYINILSDKMVDA